jgi:hypothetical protein
MLNFPEIAQLSRYARCTSKDAFRQFPRYRQPESAPAELAILYAALGDKEAAFASLEKGFEAHDLQMQFLKVDPEYDPLRSDPRFQDLLKKIWLA